MQTFTGREYLAIDIASNFGLDKADWKVRLEWFNANEPQLEQLVSQAETPALYYAGVQAWRQVQAGQSIGYMISLDATSSGLQLLACLTGDRKAAEICNVVDTGHRQDAYTRIWEDIMTRVTDPGQITREMSKSAVMKSLYGSTAVPKQVFGEGEQLAAFYDSMESMAPGAWELNQAFLQMWNPTALEHNWVLPDNFHVRTKVMRTATDVVQFLNTPYEVSYQINAPEKEGRSLGANCIHSLDGMIVREMTRRCDYDPTQIARVQSILDIDWDGINERTQDDQLVKALWTHYQKSNYLSARILDHITPDNVGHTDKAVIQELIYSLPERPFKLVSVHDCFRCLPHYGNEMRRQYNLQLQLIAKSELLSYLTSQIMGRQIHVQKHDPQLWEDILDTNYSLS